MVQVAQVAMPAETGQTLPAIKTLMAGRQAPAVVAEQAEQVAVALIVMLAAFLALPVVVA